MSAGADTSLLAERFQARERSVRIGWLALAQGERARIVGAAVRILLLARPAEELRGARLVPPHAQALFQPVSQLVARRGLARAAGALQVHGAGRSKDHECNDHRQPIYPNLSDSDSVVGGQVASGDRFVADLGRDRAVLGEEAVERALHIVFGVQLGAIRRNASPPRRPRVYQSRCLRSSRMAASSASRASSSRCSCPPFGRYARGRGAPSARARRCFPCLSSIAMRTWRRMVPRHSLTVTSGGVSPLSSASSSRKIQGYPQAPRAMRAASAPVSASMRRAASAVNRSPEPQTEMPTASFVRRISSQSARPRYICARVRGWSPTATAPPCSQARAMSGAFLLCSSQPDRSLTVTGTGAIASTTLRTVRSTSPGSFSMAAPAP